MLYSAILRGRDERLQNTVGMFVKTYPVISDISYYSLIKPIIRKHPTRPVPDVFAFRRTIFQFAIERKDLS